MRSPRIIVLLALLISAATIWVYAPLRHHEFLDYDDPQYVTENPNFRLGLTWAGVANDFEPHFGNWIPLTFFSLRVDHALYGLEPAGYFLTNVVLHTLSALLLFAALLLMTGDKTRSSTGGMTGAIGASAFVAAVFALHPLHVESVAWVTERKDTLSGFFAMATLYLYARYAAGPTTFSRFLPVMIAVTLGQLSKSMLVTLPFVLLLLDVWPLRRIDLASFESQKLRRELLVLFKEKLPLFVVIAVTSLVTYSVQSDSGAVYPVSHLPVGARLMNAVTSYGVYIRQALWPSQLAAFYPHPLILASAGSAAAAGALVVAVTLAALRTLQTRPYFAVGWFIYLGMLVPVIGVVQVGMQAHADRYMYLPLVGLTIALAYGAVDLVGKNPRARRALGVAAALAILALATTTTRQIPHWKDSLAVHTRIVEVSPHSYRSVNHLGKSLSRIGRHEEAKQHFIAAMQLAPTWAPPRVGLGIVFYQQGDIEKAIRYSELAVNLDPSFAVAHANLGASLLEAKRISEARVHLQRAIDLEDDGVQLLIVDAMPHFGLGEIELLQEGDPGSAARATQHFEDGLRIAPESAAALAKLGALYIAVGRFDESRPLLERAESLGLTTPALYTSLAQLAVQSGEFSQARDYFHISLNIEPDHHEASVHLMRLLATCEDSSIRNPAEAVRVGERALKRANGTNALILDALAVAYAADGRQEDAADKAARSIE